MIKYFEFDIALQDVSPRIWRRLLVRSTATFADLHKAIQESFGWQNYHLWEFRLPTFQGRPIAGLPGGEDYGRDTPDARRVKLSSYFSGRVCVEWCEYAYDFGDGWIHDVKLVALRAEKESFRRRLLDGDRSAPPEDCGGTPGYERIIAFLEAGDRPDDHDDEHAEDDEHDEDEEHLARWLGAWRPDAFDLAMVKTQFDR